MPRHTRTSALLDVPRVALPRAVRAYAAIAHAARMEDPACERLLPRLQSAMDRARRTWAEAERRRDEELAREALRQFDAVAVLVPPHVAPLEPITLTYTGPMNRAPNARIIFR